MIVPALGCYNSVAMCMAMPISSQDPDHVVISSETHPEMELLKNVVLNFIEGYLILQSPSCCGPSFSHILAKMCHFLLGFVYSNCPNECEALAHCGFDLYFFDDW